MSSEYRPRRSLAASRSETNVRLYDLQVHTDVSPCARARPSDVVAAARRAGLDGIAVTNHDTVDGYEAVAERAGDALDVIRGCEVTTTEGHLLALGVETAPPRGDPLAVVEAVHAQGGVAVLSHPFDTLREHYDDPATLAAAVDGVEVTNSRCVRTADNRQALAFADRHGLGKTGGSDAHFPFEVGRARTVVPGDGDPLRAIRDGTTTGRGRGRYLSGHVATKLHDYAPEWLSGKLHGIAPRWL